MPEEQPVLTGPETLSAILRQRQETIAVAETTTGGLVSAKIVAVPGSSAYFDRGIVAYSKTSKIESLRIPEERLDALGAVSAETAELLAVSVRDLAGTTYGLAETGIAGPIQGRSPKPIGTAHIAFATPSGVEVTTVQIDGDRKKIQEGIARETIAFAVRCLG
jgi:PncC family amidohydrolase